MIEDPLQSNDDLTAENIALHQINAIFKESGMYCVMLGFPEPVGQVPLIVNNVQFGNVDPNLLNNEQRVVFNINIDAAAAGNAQRDNANQLFYLDAPGGSGKTFLFYMIYDYFNFRDVSVHSCMDRNSCNAVKCRFL